MSGGLYGEHLGDGRELTDPSEEPVLLCKLCGVHETKDAAGHSNISYTYGICIDCLMNWR